MAFTGHPDAYADRRPEGSIDIRILGPIELWRGDQRLHLGGEAQRSLLAALILHANEPVSADRLIDELWGAAPGRAAAKRLHVAVARLRRVLHGSGAAGAAEHAVVATEPGGYRLRVSPDALDAARFEQLAADGHRALAE